MYTQSKNSFGDNRLSDWYLRFGIWCLVFLFFSHCVSALGLIIKNQIDGRTYFDANGTCYFLKVQFITSWQNFCERSFMVLYRNDIKATLGGNPRNLRKGGCALCAHRKAQLKELCLPALRLLMCFNVLHNDGSSKVHHS